jgi:hypothetical protein
MKLLIIMFIAVLILLLIFFIFAPKTANLEKNSGDFAGLQEVEPKKEDSVGEGEKSKDYMESEVLVKFKKALSEEELRNFKDKYNLEVLDVITNIGVYHFKILSGLSVKEAVLELSEDSLIEYAEPNYIMKFEL